MNFEPYQWQNEHQSQEINHISNPHGLVQSHTWGLPQQQLTSQQHHQWEPQRHLQLNQYGSQSLPLNQHYYAGRQTGNQATNYGVYSKGQSFSANIWQIPYGFSSNRQLFGESNYSENGTQRPSQYQWHNTQQGIIITKTPFIYCTLTTIISV